MKKVILSIVQKPIVKHLAFWVLSFYAVGSYFSISNELKFIDFIYSSFFHVPLFFLVYANLRFNIPRFLAKEQYLIYALLSLLNIGIAYFIHQLVFDFMIPLLPTDFYMVSFAEASILISVFSIYLVISTLIKLSESWYKLQLTEKQKLQLELNSLKMQINPHFLFNSLNSIYSLARKKSENTPDVVLGLSNLLRYMIYEVPDESVPIEKEIEVIKHYIELQKLRLEDNTKITFDLKVENEQRNVAPLLFFPLVENSFKHGLNGESNHNFIHIDLSDTEYRLSFKVRNSRVQHEDTPGSQYGGIGLENVKKRLKLIYKNEAEMIIKEDEYSFEVTINLNWND